MIYVEELLGLIFIFQFIHEEIECFEGHLSQDLKDIHS